MNTTPIRRSGALLVLSLSLSFLHAQVHLGVAGGVEYTRINFNESFSPSGSLPTRGDAGLRVALPVEIGFNKWFALQPEVVYNEHVTYYDYDYVESIFGDQYRYSFSGDFKHKTLEIPVLAKCKLGWEKFKVYFVAGPAVAVPLNGEWRFSYYVGLYSPNGDKPISWGEGEYPFQYIRDGYDENDVDTDKLAFSKILYNAHLGGGLEINLGRIGFTLDGRYVFGLNDLFPDAAGTEEPWSAKQRTIAVALGTFVVLGAR